MGITLCCTDKSNGIDFAGLKGKSASSELKYDQVAGHEQALKFNGDKLTKECQSEEIENYNQIFSDP